MRAPFLLIWLAACNQGVIGGDDTSGDDTGDTGKDTGHHEDSDTDGECDLGGDTSLPVGDGLPDLFAVDPANVVLTERVVTEADCAWVEQCVGGLGRRRLLRFDQRIANIGDDDLMFGDPDDRPQMFEYSLCHGHHHFSNFASYDLRDDQGNVVATGHKQAFCLLDSSRYLTNDSSVNAFPHYTCSNQGISRGWSDVYGGYLDCQWVDVTDLAPGTYTLRIAIDPTGIIAETDDSNNEASVTVTIPDPDPTVDCGFGQAVGSDRDCGWTEAGQGTCTPGKRVTVGCFDSGVCGDAGCEGNPVMRVCEGTDADCLAGGAWASADDACGTDCPQTQFLCPPSGTWTAWTANWGSNAAPSCTISSAEDAMPDPTLPCESGGVDGTKRECGWTVSLQGTCTPGESVWAGCNEGLCGLEVCPDEALPSSLDGMACDNDPMLRACAGDAPCHARQALALSDDSCGGTCPATQFTCPAQGAFTVLTAPFEEGDFYTCDVGYTPDSAVGP